MGWNAQRATDLTFLNAGRGLFYEDVEHIVEGLRVNFLVCPMPLTLVSEGLLRLKVKGGTTSIVGEAEDTDLVTFRQRGLHVALGTVVEGRPFHHPVCILCEEAVEDKGARDADG